MASTTVVGLSSLLVSFLEKLDRIAQMEESIRVLIDKTNALEIQKNGQSSGHAGVKEYYTTQEVAEKVDRKLYTVRQWCNNGRIAAKKKACGRGKLSEWMISHAEITRFQNEGLLPPDQGRNRPDRRRQHR